MSKLFLWVCSCLIFFKSGFEERLADNVQISVSDMKIQVIDMVNQERLKAGLHPLQMNESLMKSSDIRAKELKTNFSHTRPDGSDCFTVIDEDVSYKSAGENIATGQSDAESVMNSWINSKGHRKNILSGKFTHIGVGYYENENKLYWVQLFIEQ